MFFHGIKLQHLKEQYPILNPLEIKRKQTLTQIQDGKKLIKQFGIEPVHFLKSSENYSENECIKSCFEFGDVVLVYKFLARPIIILSDNEVGKAIVDIRDADELLINDAGLIPELERLIKNKPIYIIKHI